MLSAVVGLVDGAPGGLHVDGHADHGEPTASWSGRTPTGWERSEREDPVGSIVLGHPQEIEIERPTSVSLLSPKCQRGAASKRSGF